MEEVNNSKTSVNFYQTPRRNIPEDSLHTRRRKNLKSYIELNTYHMCRITVRK
jgi:hypothetical protein